MEETKQLVIVLSRNYSTGLSVIRSLGEAGYTVDLIASANKEGMSKIAGCSKYVRNHVEVVSRSIKGYASDGGRELISQLKSYGGKYDKKPVLFPTDDYTTSVMDLHREELAADFIMPTIVGGGDGCLTARMDKILQAQFAREAGLRIPQEWIISLKNEIEIPEDVLYPCFCKPIESVTGYKTEMARCNNRNELSAHLEKLKNRFADRSILVQEFLNITNEIDLSGVCLDQQIIIPAIIRKTHVAQHERGVTLAGQIVSCQELGDVLEKVIALLKKFHYVGMFDMELNIADGKIYFNEVNLRSGGPNFSYFRSGVNLPALFVKEVTGEGHSPEEERIQELGKTFVYEKVAWEDYQHGYMTRAELKECLDSADIKLLHYEPDPKPGRLFAAKMGISLVKTPLWNVLRRAKHYFLANIAPVLRGYPQTKQCNRRDPSAEKPRVLVAGRNFCSNLTMARSLGMAGYEVEVLRIFRVAPRLRNLMSHMRPDAYSRYIKAYHICVTRRDPQNLVDALIRIADPHRRMLLIPVDDLVADIADRNMDLLSSYYVMPNVEGCQGKLAALMQKDIQKKLAIEAGLPVINSCAIRAYHGQYEIPDTVTYPCFIKPNISKNSSKETMRRINNEKELRDTLNEYSAKKPVEVLVEDFIDIGREYSILGLSTKDGVVSPGFFGVLEGGHGPHIGVAMTGELLPTSRQQELIDKINAFIATLKFDGLFDVDLIEDKNGKMYFVELNLRYGASGYAVTLSGANLPGMFADYMLFNKPIDRSCQVSETGKPFISEKIMIDEYVNGYITKKERKAAFNAAQIHFLYNPGDPKAYRHFRRYYPIAAIMRQVNKLRGTSAQKAN